MKCKAQLKDHINNTVIFDGIALYELNTNGFQIEMKIENQKYIWKCYEKGLVIESQSDYKVVLILKENKVTNGHVETEFGNISLQCKTSIYKMNENCIEVEYSLIQDDESQLFHFTLEFIKEEGYVIH